MISIIFDKPKKTVDVFSYGVGSYVNKKTGKTVYTVYGITNGIRELVSLPKETTDELDKFKVNPNDVVIYRTDSEKEANEIKDYIDFLVSKGFRFFHIDMYRQAVIAKQKLFEEQKKQEGKAVSDHTLEPQTETPHKGTVEDPYTKVVPFPDKEEVKD